MPSLPRESPIRSSTHPPPCSLAFPRCLFASFIFAFLLRTRLARLNRVNAEKVRAMAAEEPEKSKSEGAPAAEGEVWDDDPRYVFMT